MTAELDFVPFDCDNHYYEAIDAFTRHLALEMLDGSLDALVSDLDFERFALNGVGRHF